MLSEVFATVCVNYSAGMERLRDIGGELTDDEDFLELLDVVVQDRRARVFRNRSNPFETYKFKQRYRLSKDVTRFVTNTIENEIASVTHKNHAVSAVEMVLITLRFLATGAFLKLVGDNSGVDESTTSRVVSKVILAIARMRPNIIKMPATEADRNAVKQGFNNIARFPRCLGAVDCTHVKIISPGEPEAEIYRNRKGFLSYNVQAVCDSNLKILDIVARWPGSTHDSNIFSNSRIKHHFETGEFGDGWLVGDKGYAIKPYLITPLRNVQTPAENLFNESQIRTRNPIERCFGVLKRRFPVLAYGIRLKLDKVQPIIIACAVLHNIACTMRDDLPENINDDIEREIAAAIIQDHVIQDNYGPNFIFDYIGRQALIDQYFQNLLN